MKLKNYDIEKFKDIEGLSKEEFLNSYNYLTEEDYFNLIREYKSFKEKLTNLKYKCPKCNQGIILKSSVKRLVNKGYFGFCFDCDEDFYSIELLKGG